MNTYRQNYKRKWMAASRSLTKKVATENANDNLNETCDKFDSSVDVVTDTQTSELYNEYETDVDLNLACSNNTLVMPATEDPTIPIQVNGRDSDNCDGYFSSDQESDKTNFQNGLVKWVNKFQIKHNAVDSLLKLLKQSGHNYLPSSARTLLKTERIISIEKKSGMDYLHYCFSDVLLANFRSYPLSAQEKVQSLEISLNIDGIPLFKSSRSSLWPVLCGIMNMTPVKVFPVTLLYGDTKPSNLDFLQEAISDLKNLLLHGLQDGDKMLPVFLRCIVCDAPARALVKSTKLFSGYFGCDKCNQRGVWCGRMTYPSVRNVELRTNQSFRSAENEEHHRGESPFCQLPINMIKQFPGDYMHQLCLGVMKKLILIWMRGKKGVKISARQVDEISEKLVNLKGSIPYTFARKPRSLIEVDRWKATEYRQFLLYTGKIVLNGVLPQSFFKHFMTLSVASCILVSPQLVQIQIDYARELLCYFVEQSHHLYGEEFLVYNVHNLIHLAEEAKEYGCLDNCSAFPFENHLQKLKQMVRSGTNPVAKLPDISVKHP